MGISYQRLEKNCAIGFFGFYIIAFFIGGEHVFLAALSLITATGFLFYGAYHHPHGFESQRQWTLLLWFSCVPVAIWIIGQSYFEEVDAHRFRSYLAEHRCKYKGHIEIGVSKGSCDRYANCSEDELIETPEYYCAVTGKLINFNDFREGRYGHR